MKNPMALKTSNIPIANRRIEFEDYLKLLCSGYFREAHYILFLK